MSKYPQRFERTADGIRLRDARLTIETPVEPAGEAARPWYWEGNVQASVARFLVAAGWTIESAADTASRRRGIDLVATKRSRRLAVIAARLLKGCVRPRETPAVEAARCLR